MSSRAASWSFRFDARARARTHVRVRSRWGLYALGAAVTEPPADESPRARPTPRALQEALARSVSESSSSGDGGVSDVVLVEFSAHWCGPCKRIRPLFDELAMVHDDLLFVYVDAEASEQNGELAHEIGVRGFPTFVVYKAGSQTESFSGADAGRLRETVQKHSARRPGGAGGAGADEMISRVKGALVALQAEASAAEFVDGARAAQTFCSNVVRNPHEEKYRRVKLKAAAFQRRLGRFQAGDRLMVALGFERRSEGGEEVYVMTQVSPSLPRVAALLEQALASTQGAASRRAGPGANAPPGRSAQFPPPQARAMMLQAAAASRTDPALAQRLAVVCAEMLISMRPMDDAAARAARAAALLRRMFQDNGAVGTANQTDAHGDEDEEEEPPPSFQYNDGD